MMRRAHGMMVGLSLLLGACGDDQNASSATLSASGSAGSTSTDGSTAATADTTAATSSESGSASEGSTASSSSTTATSESTGVVSDTAATTAATDPTTTGPTTTDPTTTGPTTTDPTTTTTTTGDPTTTTTTGDPTTTTTTGDPTTSTSTSGGNNPPDEPMGLMGCGTCECCDPWPISWASVPGATYYKVRWKCSINPEQVIDVGNVTKIGDVCNDINMCNGMCAFTVGYIKVEACNADGCSMSVNIPADQIPISCGGGCCC